MQVATSVTAYSNHSVPVSYTHLIESPAIDSITVNKVGKVRRAKLYYLRALTGKKARIQEKRVNQ